MSRMRSQAKKSTLDALGAIEGKNRPSLQSQRQASETLSSGNEDASASEAGSPPISVGIAVEKRVGDATITAYGAGGQASEIRDKVAQVAKNLKK